MSAIVQDGPIRLGVSACLMGQAVRYDAGHKRDRFVTDTLAESFELLPLCPEVAIGLGTPRPPIRLVGNPAAPRAIGTRQASLDVTDALADYGRRMVRELAGISGYILKSKSPSCGMDRVKVYGESGQPSGKGTGIYAAEIMRGNPMLPVEEEGRLNDPGLRENFIERVHAYRRWQELMTAGVTPDSLVAFHTAHKLSLMTHGPQRMRDLGRLVAQAGSKPVDALAREYGRRFMQALTYQATRCQHTDVLFHVIGFFKRKLECDDKAELVELIHDYRQGRVPLIAPVTLIRHHLRRHPVAYLQGQLYLIGPAASGAI